MNSSPSSLPKQTSNLIKAKQGAKLKSNYKNHDTIKQVSVYR